MDLSVRYLGLDLPHPFILGASPLVDDLDRVRRVEDAGASAIVMHSLFEEQLTDEQLHRVDVVESHSDSYSEASGMMPGDIHYTLGPDEYLQQLNKIKACVDIPVIGSLNGTTKGGWVEYARLIEGAGADALELNVYALHADPNASALELETQTIEMIRAVREQIRIPLALKLSPFYTSLSHFARQAQQAGVDALVLFNRFYQPDIDIDALKVTNLLHLSRSDEVLLRLRWLAILSSQLDVEFAVTGGVHTVKDAIRAIMAGASVAQLVSEVLEHGPRCFTALPAQLSEWLDQHEYTSLAQMRASMNLAHCPEPKTYERSNYIRLLQSWRSPVG